MATKTATSEYTGVAVFVIDNDYDAEWIAQWVDFFWYEFHHKALFTRLSGGVNVVDPNSPAAPTRLRFDPYSNPDPEEGFYDPVLKAIWISSQASVWDVLGHELGHHLQTECGVLPNGPAIGKALLALYADLSGNRDKPVEFMATDFRRAYFEALPFPGAKPFFEAVAAAGGL